MATAKKKNKHVISKSARSGQPATMAAAAAASAAGVPVIVVPAGATLDVVVDVGPMVFPYTVAYADHTLIKSFVDRRETVPVEPGDKVLAWAFAHGAKGWSHSIGHSINGGPVQVLEARSEKKKDPDTSVGFAVVSAQ